MTMTGQLLNAHHDGLSGADGGRNAGHRHRPRGDADGGFRARRQGRRRSRHRRRAGLRHERRQRRAAPARRRADHGDADHAGTGTAARCGGKSSLYVPRVEAQSRCHDRRLGDRHAADRLHRDHHGAAADGDLAAYRSGAALRGGDRLSAESRGFRAGQRLGGRPLSAAAPFFAPRSRCSRSARSCCGFSRQYHRADRGAGAARLRRRHDGAGRPAGAVPQRRESDADRHHGLSAGAGAARPGARPADRRLHHHVFLVALDLSGSTCRSA